MRTRIHLTIAAAVTVTLLAASASHGITVLFLGNNGTPTSGADASVMAHLQARYGVANVTYKQTSAANNTTDLIGVDVLVTSSTTGSGNIRNKYHDSAVGIVNWEEAVMDSGGGEFGMSSVGMTKSTTTTQLTIDLAHPITQGFAGTIDFAGSGETLNSSSLAGDTFSLASATNGTGAGNSAIFAVETGGAVGTSSPAEGRRVAFPITDNTFHTLTNEGKQLFVQSVDWAADAQGKGFVAPTTLAQWTFPELSNGSETGPGFAPTTVAAGVTAGDVDPTNSDINGFVENPGTNYATQPVLRVFPTNGNTSVQTAIAQDKFFEFTVGPDGGSIDLSGILFDAARGGGGTPRGWGLSSSIDNFTALIETQDIGTVRPNLTSYFVDLSAPEFQGLTSDVTFRMYVYSPGNGSTVEFDNITVLGTAAPVVPEPATAMLALFGLGGLAMRRRRAA